jgi:hypothetical protein
MLNDTSNQSLPRTLNENTPRARIMQRFCPINYTRSHARLRENERAFLDKNRPGYRKGLFLK